MRLRAGFVAVAIVLMASTAPAQLQVSERIEATARPANAPATVGELVGLLQSAAQARVRTNVISVEWSKEAFLIPVAGNAAGGGGTYFKSDVVFNNDRLQGQRIAVGWFAQGVNSCASALQYFNLGANSVTIADDFVGQSLGKTGLGGLLVVAVTAGGALDEDGLIDGYSRIWTPQPGSSGTTSQNFTAIDVQDSIGSLPATLMGLKQNNQYRTNVGVVNTDTAAHTWTFTSIFNGKITTTTVQPCSMSLVGAAAGSASASGNVAFTIKSDGFGFWWSGFGSSTDNTTGDGWVARAIQ
jgi:hypothetical protein